MRAPLVVCCLVLVAVLAPAASGATGARVQSLAAAALRGDDSALTRLQAIRVVDGRRVDLAAALGTSSGGDLHARLRLLAGRPASQPGSSIGHPRAAARAILAERRFRGSDVPRPLHGALVWAGRRLEPIGRAFRWVARRIPGGASVLWLILAVGVVTVSAAVARWVTRRRGGRRLELGDWGGSGSGAGVDPAALERAADEANAAGRWAEALRLRFRAGLLRLGRASAVPLRDSLTSGEARRALRLADFDLLARTHDEVVFGGRQASGDDAAASREGWQRVLAAKRIRP